MKIRALMYICFFCFTLYCHPQITVTSPASDLTYASAADYATMSFQDPWDMNQRTDLGWFIFNELNQLPYPYMENISFSGGMFTADSTTNGPNIFVLDTGITTTAYLGKIGTNYPIDGDTFRVLAMRLYLDHDSQGQVLWSTDTIFNGVNTSNGYFTYSGWNIYMIDLPNLGTAVGDPWQGSIDSLRVDPSMLAGEHLAIDWIRLVEVDAALVHTVTWTGNAGNVDIYLDSDRNAANGVLGKVGRNVNGSSYDLFAGALAPGTYYVGVCESGNPSAMAYAAGAITVNGRPTIQVTNPSPEGSSDDFASVQLNNAWDMDSLDDIDFSRNLSYLTLAEMDVEDEAGNFRPGVHLLKGANIDGNPGPHFYTLWWNDRGFHYHIDTDRYRLLVLRMGLDGPQDLVEGSEARIMWKVVGETMENTSEDIIIRHKSGTPVIDLIITDLKTMPLETNPGLSQTGWNGMVDGFRLDPSEYVNSKEFYVESIKLAAFQRANDSFTIQWEYQDDDSSGVTVSLFRDSDCSGYDGVLIAAGVDADLGSYVWDTSALAEGEYYVYAVIADARHTNRQYGRWPVVVDHDYNPDRPRMALSRDTIRFGVTNSGSVITRPQEILVQVENNEDIDWTVTCNRDFLEISPLSGSGTGVFTVSIKPQAYWTGTYDASITVTSAEATNSPQSVRLFMEVYSAGTTNAPFGSFATPVNQSTVQSSISVSGWALDDIEVESVKIYRESGADLVFIGDAVFVEGARPDLETSYANYPLNYRGGWGYMLLTYGLPDQGMSASYVLHAIATDKEGNCTDLGTKTIYCDNQNAVKPFGAIATPTQGGEASGAAYRNWGWALTPPPNMIPTDGSTMSVLVDGVSVGQQVYNLFRADIAALFPECLNANGAAAYYDLDTTAYVNGVHTIAWIATDNADNADGIGSRFFTIVNTSGSSVAASSSQAVIHLASELEALPLESSSLEAWVGFPEPKSGRRIRPDAGTGIIALTMEELSRLRLDLDPDSDAPADYCGYLQVGESLHPLPAGSTLQARSGLFYWQPGPGFLGDYNLVFINQKTGRRRMTRITLVPKSFPLPNANGSIQNESH